MGAGTIKGVFKGGSREVDIMLTDEHGVGHPFPSLPLLPRSGPLNPARGSAASGETL